MPDNEKIKKIQDQVFGYAPYPERGEVNPVALARNLAVSALVRRVRLDCTPVSATGMHARYIETDAVCADLAGAVALWALAATRATPEPDLEGPRGWPLIPKVIEDKSPSTVATMIRDIWDSGELGEWLWELLGKDVAEDVSALVTQLCKLTGHEVLAEVRRDDLRTALDRLAAIDPEVLGRLRAAAGLLPAGAGEAVTS